MRQSRRPLSRLLASQGAFLDRAVVSLTDRLLVSSEEPVFDRALRTSFDKESARWCNPALVQEPKLFFRCPPDPYEVQTRTQRPLDGGRRLRVTFRSTHRTYDPDFQRHYDGYERNRTNQVTMLKHDGSGWPAVLCIHPFACGLATIDERIFEAEKLYLAGFDVALPALPFHGLRTPVQAKYPGQLFPSRDVRLTNEGFGQTHADLTVLMRWLRDEHDARSVGMMGMSLGGYITALMASLDPQLAFAVTIAAPSSFADIMWHHSEGRKDKGPEDMGELHDDRLDSIAPGLTVEDLRALMAVHSPMMRPAQIPRERLLMIWGEGDRIVPGVHHLALWEHWGQPEARRFPGGHFLQYGRSSYLRDARDWIARTV